MKMTQTRRQNCPACGLMLNAASDPLNHCSPEPGDLTICAKCRTVLAFGEAMDLRLATQSEINEAEAELAMITKDFISRAYSLLNTPAGPALLCHRCGHSSSNLQDIENRYCGYCHQFLELVD